MKLENEREHEQRQEEGERLDRCHNVWGRANARLPTGLVDLALEEVELELGDDVDLFVSTSNDNKTHNNNDSDNGPLRQDREDALSRGTDYRMPLNASGCLGMHLNASQCLSMPLNAWHI